jgi:hypothetical protein
MISNWSILKISKGLCIKSVILVLVSCLLFLCACVGDNYYSFDIHILEWIDAPSNADSQVFVDSTPPGSFKNTAVDNASVEVYLGNSIRMRGGYTNRSGFFRYDGGGGPGEVVPFRVLAWKAGFQKAETSVKSGNHSIVFLLVREKASNN